MYTETRSTFSLREWTWNSTLEILYNYPPKGRRIVVDIYRDAKRRGISPPLFIDPEGDSCFSIYQIKWIKKCCFNFFFWNFRETTRHFSLRSPNSEYLVNKPLPAAGLSADNVRGWEIVRKMNIWPRSEASRANVKFWGQSLSQGHYKPIDQQAGKGFIYFITLPLIFFAIKPRVNMIKKPVVIWWRMRAWLTWGSKSKFDWFN